jgi:hypothetical protein
VDNRHPLQYIYFTVEIKKFERCDFESRLAEVYSIQHYVIKFVTDLRQVRGFLRVHRFPPPIKLELLTRVTVFNATFNNISAISWRPVLLVEETGVPVENL